MCVLTFTKTEVIIYMVKRVLSNPTVCQTNYLKVDIEITRGL